MASQLLRGCVEYTSSEPGRVGKQRGREWWTITKFDDDARTFARTLQTYTETDGPPSLRRWVTLSVDHAMHPTDAFVRIVVADRLIGSSWFQFGKDFASCEAQTIGEGRFSQHFKLDRPTPSLGTHPIQGDAWFMSAVPTDRGTGKHRVTSMTTSLDHRGATGPTIVPISIDVHYYGIELVTVKAGSFEAYHFSLGSDKKHDVDDPLKHPQFDIWVSADNDWLMLKAEVRGYMQSKYELVSLSRD